MRGLEDMQLVDEERDGRRKDSLLFMMAVSEAPEGKSDGGGGGVLYRNLPREM